jgi:hypothetical protein
MSERQVHGFDYENEILKKIGAKKSENYTSKIDGYYEINNLKIPISVKTKKNKCAIEMGDIFRNSEVSSDFILIVAFWEKNKYNFVEEYIVYVRKKIWSSFFLENFEDDYLNFLSSVSNDFSDDLIWKEGCKLRQEVWEKEVGKNITPYFKRDHKKQKRVQCGLSYATFMNIFVKDFIIDIENFDEDLKKFIP